MDEKGNRKICPLIVAGAYASATGCSSAEEECRRDLCAWWARDQCAMRLLALGMDAVAGVAEGTMYEDYATELGQ